MLNCNKENVLLQYEILNNIKKLHNNAINEQKSNILSLVAYKYLNPTLKELGFKYSSKQFKNAEKKRINKGRGENEGKNE